MCVGGGCRKGWESVEKCGADVGKCGGNMGCVEKCGVGAGKCVGGVGGSEKEVWESVLGLGER